MTRSLISVIAGTFTLRLSTGLTGLMLVFYLGELEKHGGVEVTPVEISLIAIFFYGTELTLSPAFGMLADRIGRKPVMQLGPIFGGAAAIITGLTAYLPLLLGTRILEGGSTAASVPAILGFIAIATARDEGIRGRAVAAFEVASIGGLGAGGLIAGFLWGRFGPAAFFLNAGLYMVSLAIYTLGVDEPGVRQSIERRGQSAMAAVADAARGIAGGVRASLDRYAHLVSRSHVLLLAPTWIALNAAIGVFSIQSVFQLIGGESDKPFAHDQLLMQGFTPANVSLGLGIGFAVFIIGMLFWGNQFKRFRRTSIIAIGVSAAMVGIVDLFLLNHSGDAPVLLQLAAVLVAGAALFVLAGATPAALGLLADVSESYPNDRGAIMGLYSVFLGVGQILGNALAGVAAELRGIDGLLALTFALVLVALVPIYSLRQYEHQIGAEAPDIVPRPRTSGATEP
jgi:MFS family permease